jgi:hypothetical protein
MTFEAVSFVIFYFLLDCVLVRCASVRWARIIATRSDEMAMPTILAEVQQQTGRRGNYHGRGEISGMLGLLAPG